MNKKGKQKELSASQSAHFAKLIVSFEKVAAQRIDKKVGKQKGGTNSIRTQKATREVIKTALRRMYDLGYQLSDIKNLQQRHVFALVEDWHRCGVQPKTINNYLSIIRKCSGWLGKPTLVPSVNAIAFFLPDVDKSKFKVSGIALVSKSWSEQGINVTAKIRQADAICPFFGAMLRLSLAFGLRRKEQLRFVPSISDGGTRLMLRGSMSKTRRDRDIDIVDDFQRYALDHAKKIARRGHPLGWAGRTYVQSVNRYNYLMSKKLGITGRDADCVGHGLRAEFAENMALLLGLVPPTLGGARDQLPAEDTQQIRSRVTRAMGHNRLAATGAYYGSFRLTPQGLGPKLCSMMIDGSLTVSLHINPSPPRDAAGALCPLTAIQLTRSSVHIQIDRDGQTASAGTWRISGIGVASLAHVDVLGGGQRKLLSDSLRTVLGGIPWE